MKRFICAVICIIMAFSAISVSAANVPNFMKQDYNNYTADYNMSLSFKSGAELDALFEEIGVKDEMSRQVDIQSFFETLLTSTEKANLQYSISEDYKKIDVALVSEVNQKIKPNVNLDVDIKAKSGMWLHADVAKQEFTFAVSMPYIQKYAIVDASEFEDEVKAVFFATLDTILNKDTINPIKEAVMELLLKHADVSMKSSKCVVKYDNDALIATLDEFVGYILTLSEEFGVPADEEIPSFEGLTFLGDKGITITYNLKGTKMGSIDMKADFAINISEIYTKFSGEEWPYETEGKLEFEFKSKEDISKLGTTKPVIPEFTEENSFSIVEEFFGSFGEVLDPEGYYEDVYVHHYASCWDTPEIAKDGVYFAPLKELVEYAYENCSEVIYAEDGVKVILSAPEMPQKELVFAIGDTNVSVTDVESGEVSVYTVSGATLMKDGIIYVSTDFFEKCLGWTLVDVTKDVLSQTMSYEYETGYYNDDYYEDMAYVDGYAYCDNVAQVSDGDVYLVPLRRMIEDAYVNCSEITYDNGNITIILSDPEAQVVKLTLSIGDNKVLVTSEGSEEVVYTTYAAHRMVDGMVFVSTDFFEKCLGWTMSEISLNVLENTLSCGYDTGKWDY